MLCSLIPIFYPSTTNDYDAQKIAGGKERIDILEIHVEQCGLTNGVAPCTATSTCINTWSTCKSRSNFASQDLAIRFCTPVSYVPNGMIPFLKKVKSDSAEPDPEIGLGKIASVNFTLIDAPHSFIGIDPYIDSRAFDSMQSSTFWPRFKSLWPNYYGRRAVWYRGYVHYPFDLANCKKTELIADALSGWGRGDVSLTAKDPLKLAENDKAEYPIRSTGRLSDALLKTDEPTYIDIVTDRSTEYDIKTHEPSYSFVRIGDEIIKYTSVSTITDGVRLSGLDFDNLDQYTTTREDHEAGDEVQKCAYFKAARPIDVFYTLLRDVANISDIYLPYDEWYEEAITWIAGFKLTRLICDPEGVNDILSELIKQTSTFAIWWDDEENLVKYRVNRPADVSEVVAALNDNEHIIQNTARCFDETNRLINEVYVTLGQKDPTKKIDEIGNYKEGFVTINTDSQSELEANIRKSTTIYGRWHPTSNRAEMLGVVDRMLLNRSYVPIRIEFELDRKDDSIKTGDFVDLTTAFIPDAFGQLKTTRVRVLKSRNGEDFVKITAREDAWASERVGTFARIAPDTFASGYDYADATTQEKSYYIFIADNDGLLNNSDNGYVLL